MGFREQLQDHLKCLQRTGDLEAAVQQAARMMTAAIVGGKKILACGNGGSAADAQHFAAEIVGRFQHERPALPAIALTTDTSVITALANDYGYEHIFARQLEALGSAGDILVGISTSGNSANVIRAATVAGRIGMKTILLLGGDGGALAKRADLAIVVPGRSSFRIQEGHIFILHYWAGEIEAAAGDPAPE